MQAQNGEIPTGFLSTGLRLDPAGEAVELGSMPLGMALAPGGERAAVVLSGWREQGLQIVDLKTRRALQTLPQEAAFFGIAFSANGGEIYVSGGNADAIYCYTWKDGAAALDRRIALAEQRPARQERDIRAPGIAVSRRGNYLYVAENVSDTLAVVDLATSRVVARFPTDHYPYAVAAAANGKVYVSNWGADTVSIFKPWPTDAPGRGATGWPTSFGAAVECFRIALVRGPGGQRSGCCIGHRKDESRTVFE